MKPVLLAQIDFNTIYRELYNVGISPKLPGGLVPGMPGGAGFQYATLGNVITVVIPFLYVVAGLILFAFLIIGGFGYLFSAGDQKKVESAKQKITAALTGFVIIFVSYWLAQILQIILDIQIF